MAPDQLESGEIQPPNFELEKKVPAIEIFASNTHRQIEEEETCTDAPGSDHMHPASFLQWPSGANAAVPASPAPIHSNPTDKKMNFAAVSVDN